MAAGGAADLRGHALAVVGAANDIVVELASPATRYGPTVRPINSLAEGGAGGAVTTLAVGGVENDIALELAFPAARFGPTVQPKGSTDPGSSWG